MGGCGALFFLASLMSLAQPNGTSPAAIGFMAGAGIAMVAGLSLMTKKTGPDQAGTTVVQISHGNTWKNLTAALSRNDAVKIESAINQAFSKPGSRS